MNADIAACTYHSAGPLAQLIRYGHKNNSFSTGGFCQTSIHCWLLLVSWALHIRPGNLMEFSFPLVTIQQSNRRISSHGFSSACCSVLLSTLNAIQFVAKSLFLSSLCILTISNASLQILWTAVVPDHNSYNRIIRQ